MMTENVRRTEAPYRMVTALQMPLEHRANSVPFNRASCLFRPDNVRGRRWINAGRLSDGTGRL